MTLQFDILYVIASFCNNYLQFASVCKDWQYVWHQTNQHYWTSAADVLTYAPNVNKTIVWLLNIKDGQICDPKYSIDILVPITIRLPGKKAIEALSALKIDWSKHHYFCEVSAHNGHEELIKWAYDNGAYVNNWTAVKAAASGNLPVIEWMFQMGLEMYSTHVCDKAAANDHLIMFKWFHKRNIGFNANSILRITIWFERFRILQWFYKYGFIKNWTKFCIEAAQSRKLEVLKWAHNVWTERSQRMGHNYDASIEGSPLNDEVVNIIVNDGDPVLNAWLANTLV